jgi:hypothetical protein
MIDSDFELALSLGACASPVSVAFKRKGLVVRGFSDSISKMLVIMFLSLSDNAYSESVPGLTKARQKLCQTVLDKFDECMKWVLDVTQFLSFHSFSVDNTYPDK